MTAKPFLLITLLLLFATFSMLAIANYVPHAGDRFSYYEVDKLGNGVGNYSGYSEQTIINGTETMVSIRNGIVSDNYSFAWTWSNSTGGRESRSYSGNFTFSAVTFLYVNGTDNETRYFNPTVWFCMNNSLSKGDTFYLLNTEMTIISKNHSYLLPSENKNVYTIYAQGNSSYQRNDVYGQFNATYTWDAYFDPSSGYIIGYNYLEQDTNSTTGNGFTYTETFYINSASYSLTAVPAAPNLIAYAIIAIIVVIIVIIVLIVAFRKKSPKTPTSQQANIPPSREPKGPTVNCPYCGGPINFGDKDITNCEYCGREVQKPSVDS